LREFVEGRKGGDEGSKAGSGRCQTGSGGEVVVRSNTKGEGRELYMSFILPECGSSLWAASHLSAPFPLSSLGAP